MLATEAFDKKKTKKKPLSQAIYNNRMRKPSRHRKYSTAHFLNEYEQMKTSRRGSE